MSVRSLVVGASGGIGRAFCRALAQEGEVCGLSRSDGVDVTDESSVQRSIGALEGHFDMIIVATGALGTPEKSLRSFDATALAAQIAVNAAGPLLVLKHSAGLLPRDRRSVFAVLSARVGSIGDNRLGGWYSYRASKAALNQLLHTASIELARSHRHAVLAALHPGTVDTNFTSGYGNEKVSADVAATRLLAVLNALRPEQSGGFYDFAGNAVPW
jgi:NAD(P)-dependent dehydrogenase (short-subunit alcohol dehydrogenase family)